MNKIILLFFLTISCAIYSQIDANSVMGLPTAATIAEMNRVTGANDGSVLYNLEDQKIYVFNGTNWVSISNGNWLIDGNTGLTSASFLGHRDDVKMEIRSNDLPLLQFGRRETLGLTLATDDYNDPDQPLVYVNGDGITSALQFAADAANFYKPIFFTTTDGNFRLKGSAAGNDFFEIGSAGTANNGSMEFIIGDDGSEPFIFKRFYDQDNSFNELMRIQGSKDGPNAKTRVGINTGVLANSTLQLSGSFSKPIQRTNAALTLTEDHYSIIIENTSHTILLPAATGNLGREYVIKNPNDTEATIANYRDASDQDATTIPAENILKIQSDGTYWNQMNNYVEGTSGSSGLTPTGVLSTDFRLNRLQDDISTASFQLQLNGPTPAVSQNYEILLNNVPYSLENIKLGDHTVIENDNGDGTFDYLFTSTSAIPNNNGFREIIADTPVRGIGIGASCGCVEFYLLP